MSLSCIQSAAIQLSSYFLPLKSAKIVFGVELWWAGYTYKQDLANELLLTVEDEKKKQKHF